MSRSELRRAQREAAKKHKAVYSYTEEQLQSLFLKWMKTDPKSAYAQGRADGVADAFSLMIGIPIQVLLDKFDFVHEEVVEFAEAAVDLYDKWTRDEVDMKKIQKDVWEYGGVKIVVEGEE